MNDEENLLWMRNALNKVVTHVNKKYPKLHLSPQVEIECQLPPVKTGGL